MCSICCAAFHCVIIVYALDNAKQTSYAKIVLSVKHNKLLKIVHVFYGSRFLGSNKILENFMDSTSVVDGYDHVFVKD